MMATTATQKTWTVVYYDPTTNTYPALPNAAVSGEVIDPFGPVTTISTYTDASGGFTAACEEYYQVDFQVRAENWGVIVVPNTTVASYNDAGHCTTSTQIIALSDESRVFVNVDKARGASIQVFGRNRPRIAARLDPALTWSYYNPTTDELLIYSGHIWGNRGAEVEAHEYGHAYHEHALGGYPRSTNCANHGTPVYTDLACALTEGFAEYFAVQTRPDATADFAVRFERDEDLLINSNPDAADPNNPDGSVIEGAVAAFLYDLTDPANEAHDLSQFPGTYVADIIATCEVSTDGLAFAHAAGIDHLINCFEASVDASINGYFYFRSPHPVAERESGVEPSGWSVTNVRTLWKKNLYNE